MQYNANHLMLTKGTTILLIANPTILITHIRRDVDVGGAHPELEHKTKINYITADIDDLVNVYMSEEGLQLNYKYTDDIALYYEEEKDKMKDYKMICELMKERGKCNK